MTLSFLQWICNCRYILANDDKRTHLLWSSGPGTVLGTYTRYSFHLPKVPIRGQCYRWGSQGTCPSLEPGCLAPAFSRVLITDKHNLWWTRRQKKRESPPSDSGDPWKCRLPKGWGGRSCRGRCREAARSPLLHRGCLDPFPVEQEEMRWPGRNEGQVWPSRGVKEAKLGQGWVSPEGSLQRLQTQMPISGQRSRA